MVVNPEGNVTVWFIPEQLLKLREGLTKQVAWLTNVQGPVTTVWATMQKYVSRKVEERIVGGLGAGREEY